MIKEPIHDPIFLAGLSKMYVVNELFKNNIKKYGVDAAEFASETTIVFLRKDKYGKYL